MPLWGGVEANAFAQGPVFGLETVAVVGVIVFFEGGGAGFCAVVRHMDPQGLLVSCPASLQATP